MERGFIMAEHREIARQSDQGHTRKQPSAVSVCQKLDVLSIRNTGMQLYALDVSQLLLHYFLNTNNKWEPAGSFSLAGSCG